MQNFLKPFAVKAKNNSTNTITNKTTSTNNNSNNVKNKNIQQTLTQLTLPTTLSNITNSAKCSKAVLTNTDEKIYQLEQLKNSLLGNKIANSFGNNSNNKSFFGGIFDNKPSTNKKRRAIIDSKGNANKTISDYFKTKNSNEKDYDKYMNQLKNEVGRLDFNRKIYICDREIKGNSSITDFFKPNNDKEVDKREKRIAKKNKMVIEDSDDEGDIEGNSNKNKIEDNGILNDNIDNNSLNNLSLNNDNTDLKLNSDINVEIINNEFSNLSVDYIDNNKNNNNNRSNYNTNIFSLLTKTSFSKPTNNTTFDMPYKNKNLNNNNNLFKNTTEGNDSYNNNINNINSNNNLENKINHFSSFSLLNPNTINNLYNKTNNSITTPYIHNPNYYKNNFCNNSNRSISNNMNNNNMNISTVISNSLSARKKDYSIFLSNKNKFSLKRKRKNSNISNCSEDSNEKDDKSDDYNDFSRNFIIDEFTQKKFKNFLEFSSMLQTPYKEKTKNNDSFVVNENERKNIDCYNGNNNTLLDFSVSKSGVKNQFYCNSDFTNKLINRKELISGVCLEDKLRNNNGKSKEQEIVKEQGRQVFSNSYENAVKNSIFNNFNNNIHNKLDNCNISNFNSFKSSNTDKSNEININNNNNIIYDFKTPTAINGQSNLNNVNKVQTTIKSFFSSSKNNQNSNNNNNNNNSYNNNSNKNSYLNTIITLTKNSFNHLFLKQNTKTNFSFLTSVNSSIFSDITKYLTIPENSKIRQVCKTWNKYYKLNQESYFYYSKIDSSKFNTERAFNEMLKCNKLSHIRLLENAISYDFGKHSRNFLSRCQFQIKLSDLKSLNNKKIEFRQYSNNNKNIIDNEGYNNDYGDGENRNINGISNKMMIDNDFCYSSNDKDCYDNNENNDGSQDCEGNNNNNNINLDSSKENQFAAYNSEKGILLDIFKIKPTPNSSNFLSNNVVIQICKSSKYTLKELTLRGCIKVTNRISESLSGCVLLEKLDLSENNNIDHTLIHLISKSLKELTSLSLACCSSINDQAIKEMFRFKKLKALELTSCRSITSPGFFNIKFIPSLEKLLLANVMLDETNIQFLEYLTNLNTLSLDRNEFITDKGLKFIATKCENIINISIRMNDRLSEACVYDMLSKNTNIQNIAIDVKNKSDRVVNLLSNRRNSNVESLKK